MFKKIMSVFMVIVMLSATVMPIGVALAATNPTVTVKVNGTTLNKSNTYIIDNQQTINVSASHSSGISKIYYKIGTSATQSVDAASTTVTIPASYTNSGEFSFNVCALAKDGTLSDWDLYKLNAKSENDSTEPTVTVKVNGTTLKQGNTYIIDDQQAVNITASHSDGISKIYYKIGTSTMQSVNGSSTTVTIPASYTNSGEFSFNVCAVTKNNQVGEWHLYKLNAKEETDSSEPVVKVKVNGTTLKSSNTYIIDNQQEIKITASHADGISKIYYKIGTSTMQSVNGSSATVTIPASYTNSGEFSFNVCAVTKNDKVGEWHLYKLNAKEDSTVEESKEPVVTVKINGTALNTANTYLIDDQQKVYITAEHASGISKIYYKIGTSTTQSVNGSSATVTIPASYTNDGEFSFNVCAVTNDGKVGQWYLFKLNATTETEASEPTVTVKVNGTTLNTVDTYLIDPEQEVVVTASHTSGISKIYYKIGTSTTQSVNGSTAKVKIPASYTNDGEFSFNVCAVTNDGTVGTWHLYKLNAKVDSTSEKPVVNVTVDGEPLVTNSLTKLEEGKELKITASHDSGISKIYYKIGTSETKTVSGATATVVIPEEYTNSGKFTFNVCATSKDGVTSDWKSYILEITDGNENITYPFIIQPDERYNSDVDELSIALRTIPLTTKSGNQNYFVLKEYIQYNIDFVNGGDKINDKVYIYLTIPDDVSVNFVDVKGGTKVDSNTIRWTFEGLAAGEKGTIPVTLYYTSIPNDATIVRPYAEIVSGNAEDSSAVINLITKSNSTEVASRHEPFMIGDAGTNTFRPNEGINRAEVAMILVRIFDLPLVNNYTVSYKDADVIAEGRYAWATQAIMTVTKYGLMEGYDDGTFRPGTQVTKAQLITILARKFELDGRNETHNPFEIKDEPIKLFNNLSFTYPLYGYNDHWAAKYLAQMIRLNMLPEFANTIDGNLDLVISRADTAKLICSVLLRGPSTDGTANKSLTNTFIDVNSYTTNYEYILEASADVHNSEYQKSGWEKMVK